MQFSRSQQMDHLRNLHLYHVNQIRAGRRGSSHLIMFVLRSIRRGCCVSSSQRRGAKPLPAISGSDVTCSLALGLNWANADDRNTMTSGEKRFAPRQQCSSKEQENKPATANDIRRSFNQPRSMVYQLIYSELLHIRAKGCNLS